MCVDVSQIHLQYYKKLPRISSVDRQQIKKYPCFEVFTRHSSGSKQEESRKKL